MSRDTGRRAVPGREAIRPTDEVVGRADRLVALLYSEAIANLRRARQNPQQGSAAIPAVLGILSELSVAAASTNDRDAVTDLLSLYHYMTYRLTTAHGTRTLEVLGEVEHLFVTLFDGWMQVLQSELPTGFPDRMAAADGDATVAVLPSP